MKPTSQLFALAAAAFLSVAPGVSAQQDDEFAPEVFEPGRYRASYSYSASAFEREILPQKDTGEETRVSSFDLALIGATGKDGDYRVVLVDKKGRYHVVTAEPNADGYYYTAIKPSLRIQDFRVEVARGSHREWAVFDASRYEVISKSPNPNPTPKRVTGRRVAIPSRKAVKK